MLKRLQEYQWHTWALTTLAVAAMYVIGGLLVMLPFHSKLTNLFWPPAGFAFAALWWFGKRGVAGVALGSMLVNIFVMSIYQPGHILLLALGNAAEALLAVWWLRRQGISDIFLDAESILKFIVAAVLLAPIPAAAIGAASLWFNNLQTLAQLPQTGLAWWIGDSMGVLLVAPFLLAPSHFSKNIPSASRLLEFASVGLLLVWLWFNLFMTPPATSLPPLSFVAIPLIIWVAVRFDTSVLASVLFMISLFAIYGTSIGNGPFARAALQESIAYLYGFLWTVASVGLFLGVSIAHSRRSMENLAQQHRALQNSEEGLRKTLENTPNVAVQWYDASGKVLYWNNASETLYGWRSDEVLGKTLDQLIYTPEEAKRFKERLDQVASSGAMIGPLETPVRHRGGNTGAVISTIFAMPEADGNPRRFVCMDVDISRLKQTEDALRISKTHLEEAQRIAHLGSWEWDTVADQYTSSAEARRIMGVAPETTSNFGMVNEHIHPDDRDARLNAWARACTYPNHEYEAEFRIIRPDGEIRFIHSRADVIYDDQARPIRAVGTIQDITEIKLAKAEIERLAYYDELTGLPNRSLLRNRLAQAIAQAVTSSKHVALLFVDIDHFKTLNDCHGHETGDRLLKLAAARIQQCLPKAALLARPGGDEFGIILPDLAENAESASQTAMEIAENVRNVLTMPFDFGDHVYYSSASIGGVMFPGASAQTSTHDLMKQADTALFRAKDSGRNAICFFEAHMQDTVTARLDMEQDLREALGKHELKLYLQPQINEHGRMVGAECLLRWQHPRHGLMSPATFIPVAENTGLILSIGKWVLHQACAIIARLDAADQNMRISVNVSPRQFRQPDFVLQVKEILETTGAEPQRLVLEITESVVLDNVNEVITRMTELERIGVGFSIDDFGTGYSSLSYLKHLPLRELKIDKSFVDGLPRNLDDGAIVGSILALAQNLGLEVVAEGIETTEQLEYLKTHGCQVFQGYLHGRPVACEELLATLLPR